MSDWVRAFLAWYAGHEIPGLFLFLLIEETGVPLLLPGDTLIIVAGARDRTLAGALVVIGVAALASALGSSVLYALMRRGGRPLLDRYGPRLHLDADRVARLERLFRRHGAIAIVVGRLVPGFRTPTTVMAGVFGVPYRTFVPSTTAAAVIWAAAYFYLGAALERTWRRFAAVLLANERLVVGIAVGLVLLCVLGWLTYQRFRQPGPVQRDPGGPHRGGPPGAGLRAARRHRGPWARRVPGGRRRDARPPVAGAGGDVHGRRRRRRGVARRGSGPSRGGMAGRAPGRV